MGHTTQEELVLRLEEAKTKVEVGGLYFHYKNREDLYRLVMVVMREDTEEPAVIYEALYGEKLVWDRRLEGQDGWLDEVEYKGKKVARFQKYE